MSEPRIRVLGPVEGAIEAVPLRLSKSRHRELLALLTLAHGRAVSTSELIDELWDEPAPGAVGAVRTFIGELRRILEPHRPAHAPPTVLVTVGDGYALRLAPDGVDLWRAERSLREATGASPETAAPLIAAALAEWRGSAVEEFATRPWAQSERTRLATLRADAVEQLADALLALDRASEVIPLLEQQVVAYPWREGGWRVLALALYREERQSEALIVLGRARKYLADDLGLDPGRRLADLERGILRSDSALDPPRRSSSLLIGTATAHSQTGARTQLESASTLLPRLAVSGGLEFATEQRRATIAAAEELSDPELTARIIGSFDVPGIWTRSDDPVHSAAIVSAALRTLAALPSTASDRARARLLATLAMESRGTASHSAEAHEAERIARSLGDPQLLCFALSARYMQNFETTGLARDRERLASELIAIAQAAELPTFEIHGHLIRMQALCALDDINAAAAEADVVDALAAQHERPLVTVFTSWFRWTFTDAAETPPTGREMPGFSRGIVALAHLTHALRADADLPDGDFGPYEPWARPLLLARAGRREEAAAALEALPAPPLDLMLEVSWFLVGQAALEIRELSAARRARDALLPAAAERAAGSAVVDLGPLAALLGELDALLNQSDSD
ncbi:BTAD domain-containing putative transcriptional regulator [Leifsonia kafniensis]|uniref:BTAD domain-containing putative transcriptional regulator n=1 Tax=Leifsonia kafniensis TaxID=475957 RepID=A0ABP7KMI8_9MICO